MKKFQVNYDALMKCHYLIFKMLKLFLNRINGLSLPAELLRSLLQTQI